MNSKGKLFDAISIVSICGTILIISFVIIFKMRTANNVEVFLAEANVVYDLAIKQNEKDRDSGLSAEDYSYYKSTVITSNKAILNYIAVFNKETKELDYICVTDGKLKIAIEGEISKEIMAESQIINSTKGCEFK